MANKFYAVTAKCGHVGRCQYYEATFYVRAVDARAAAAIVRNRPRVKHDHKDAILLPPTEISYEEFKVGQEEFASNPYHNCKSKWQQKLVWDKIAPFLRPETDLQREYRLSDRRSGKRPAYTEKPKFKKPYKRERLSLPFDYEYVYAV